MAEISGISGKNGEIDHDTLPAFARRTTTRTNPGSEVEPVKVVEQPGRDLGAMVSVLTVAVQQLLARLEKLEGGNMGKTRIGE